MKILKIQKDVLETIADSELRCNVRYCYNSDTENIGISPDGATCYFIPKDQFFLSTEGITNIDRDTFFKPGFSEKHDEHRLKPHKMDIPRHNYLF